MERQRRRLAAILFADVVGSSRLISRDESGTVARLLDHLAVRLAPAAKRRGGRVVRLTGDGGLVEFTSAVDALAAAIEFQQAMALANRDEAEEDAIRFRVGLHLGDIIVEHGDLYGDDVNLAARLQEVPSPGGIAVSRAVREAVVGRIAADFTDLGELALKNLGRTVQAFAVSWTPADWPVPAEVGRPPAWPSPAWPIAARPRRWLVWPTVAAGIAMVVGSAWLLVSPPPPTKAQLQSLKAEDLERLLAERRAADAAAAEKRRLEEEAQVKAEQDAAALRQADADLEKAQADRRRAENELAKLRAEIAQNRAMNVDRQHLAESAAQRAMEEEAQRRAEAEANALRLAEAEAQQKALAEAENKRRADEALAQAQAERLKADQEATARAAAEAAVAEARRLREDAEAAETGLRLASVDRQRLQVALTVQGLDTHGTDGVFGPRTREMIAGWQRKSGATATGYFTLAQRDALLRAAAPAVTRWDEDRKRAEEERKKAELAKLAPPVDSLAQPTSSPTQSTAESYDGTYSGTSLYARERLTAKVRIERGRGAGTIAAPGCEDSSFAMTVSATGEISGRGDLLCPVDAVAVAPVGPFKVSGRARGGEGGSALALTLTTSRGPSIIFTLQPARSVAAAAPPPPRVDRAAVRFDGLYGGVHLGSRSLDRFSIRLDVRSGAGTGVLSARGCAAMPFAVSISPTGAIAGNVELKCPITPDLVGAAIIAGTIDPRRVTMTFTTDRNQDQITLDRLDH